MQRFCLDCNKPISYGHKRCKKCCKQGKLHSFYGKNHSDETKLKISKTLSGRIIPDEIKEKIRKSTSGINCPNYIDGRSMVDTFCLGCGKLINYRNKRCIKCFNATKKDFMRLNNNPNWRGGKSFEPYPLGWTKTHREQIRNRDGYKCQLCGVHEVEVNRRLSVHHIDYNKSNLLEKNLISLCPRCHTKTNYNREKWIEFFKGRFITI